MIRLCGRDEWLVRKALVRMHNYGIPRAEYEAAISAVSFLGDEISINSNTVGGYLLLHEVDKIRKRIINV